MVLAFSRILFGLNFSLLLYMAFLSFFLSFFIFLDRNNNFH